MSEGEGHEPSLLPSWSRAHVIAHITRKTHSHVWLLDGARTGEVRDQHTHPEMSDAHLLAADEQPLLELRAELAEAFTQIEDSFSTLPDECWSLLGLVQPGHRTMAEVVFRHLRDVEVHHVDLGV
ncbi:MAG: maleylpyruvate isomerase N-terminal domain-containing protein, partial [Mycobacteriales bacterium]